MKTNRRAQVVVVALAVFAVALAAGVRAQDSRTPPGFVRRPMPAPPAILPTNDLRARRIDDILPAKTTAEFAPIETQHATMWVEDRTAAGVVNQIRGESEVIQVAAEMREPEHTAGLSQRLQSIRRQVTSEYAPAAPAGTGEPAPIAEPLAARPAAPAQLETRTETADATLPSVLKRPAGGASPAPVDDVARPTAAESSRRPAAAVESSSLSNDTLTSTRGPQIRVETIGPKSLVLGKQATYTIQIMNGPTVAAQGVEVVIDLPPSAQLGNALATIGSAQLQKSQEGAVYLKWTIPQMEPNSKGQLTVGLTPTDGKPFDLRVEWACQSHVATARIEVQEPKLEITVAGPRDLLYGEKKSFTVTVTNPGTGDAENVVLILPPALRGNTNGEKSLGTLRAGGHKDIELEVVPREAGALSLAIEARADGNLQTAATQEVVVRRAQLEARLEAPKLKYAGTEAGFRMHLSNTGDAPAENVAANLVLPAGVQVVSASEGGKTAQPGRVTWNVGRLAVGASRSFDVRCLLASPGECRVELVATGAGELVASQDATTLVESLADLKLEINDPQGPVQVGEDVKYEIHITNRGTKAAQQVRVVAFFSEGVEPISAEGGGGKIQPGQVTFEPLMAIEPGQKAVLRVSARATKGGDLRFRAEVEHGTPSTRVAAEDSTRFFEADDVGTPGNKSDAQNIGRRPTAPQRLDIRR